MRSDIDLPNALRTIVSSAPTHRVPPADPQSVAATLSSIGSPSCPDLSGADVSARA